MRIRVLLFFSLFSAGPLACGADPPAPQIPLARPGSERCVAYPAQPIDRTCLPRLAAENAPLALEVEERCGSCSSSIEKCAVTVSGRDITLSLDGRSCRVDDPCSGSCTKNRATCRLPALPAGRYNIRYADADGRVEPLEVGAGGVTKCALDEASGS